MKKPKLPPPDSWRAAILPACLILSLAWVYWPTLGTFVHKWSTDSEYSHGYVVPLFSLYLLWSRRDTLAGCNWLPSRKGLLLLAAGFLLHFCGSLLFIDWLRQISLLPCLAGIALLFGGSTALRWSAPAILFLFFMVPLPFRIETALAYPLQRIATLGSAFALQTLGFVAFAQGNIIHFGEHKIEVVQACNGLSMLMVFFALSVAMVLVVRLNWIEKIIIIFSAIPIAVFSNIVRIVVTAVLYEYASVKLAQIFFHDLAGWLMMVFALGILWLELRVLSWVLIPALPDEDLGLSNASPENKSNRSAALKDLDLTSGKNSNQAQADQDSNINSTRSKVLST